MNGNFYGQERARESGFSALAGISLSQYTAKTFLTMFLGLLLTFGVAVTCYISGLSMRLLSLPGMSLLLLIAELALVIGMTAAIHKITVGTAGIFFYLYSAVNGLVFSAYFELFSLSSLILVFGATALYFGGMALFGYLTNIDLSRIGTVLTGGLIFLLLANLLLLFFPGLQMIDRAACTLGMLIFLVFTAYDTQKIKSLYVYYSADQTLLRKASIVAALQLYLDFVNLFLYVLRLFGRRRD